MKSEQIEKQVCQLCKKSYPDTTFPPCDGDNLCQKCYQYIEELKRELQNNYKLWNNTAEERDNLKQKLEEIEELVTKAYDHRDTLTDKNWGFDKLSEQLKEILEKK